MKSKGAMIMTIILLAIIAILLISILVVTIVNSGEEGKISFFGIGNQTQILVQKEIEMSEIDKIKVDVSSANVKIVEGNEEKAKVTIYGYQEEKYDVISENQELAIKQKDTFHIFILFLVSVKREVKIELPKSYEGEIAIRATSGNTQITDLEKTNITVESTSGNVKCGNLKNGKVKTTSGNILVGNADEISLQASSGNIQSGNMRKGKIETTSGGIKAEMAEEIEAKATSGGIRIEKANQISAKTNSGSIHIEQINDSCNLSATSGGIQIKHCQLSQNSEIHATSGSVAIEELQNAYVETSTTSGSAKVANNDRKAESVLKITTTSGNIKINQ